MKERPFSLRAMENRESYTFFRDFILDEGMKAVNFGRGDFSKKEVKNIFGS